MPLDPLGPSEDKLDRFSMQGISLTIPPGWESRIRKAAPLDDGGATFPVLHAATIPLPADRADYGGGVVEQLGSADVFVSLIEFGDEARGSNLYAEVQSMPVIVPEMFNPYQLQRKLPGQAGLQVFFTLNGRAFCLYVVIGAYSRRIELAARANQLVRGLAVTENP